MSRRECGSCQLCCRLMPVEEFGKPANERCRYQKNGRGCTIHDRKPMSCSLWNCRWLVNDDMDDQPRPDRSGIVLDIIPDVIRITPDDGTPALTKPVIVAWIDPARKDAMQSTAFRRYVARQKLPVLIRFGSKEGGGVMFPPYVTGRDEIAFQQSELGADMPTTLQEKAAAIGGYLELPDETETIGEAVLVTPDGKRVSIATQWRDK